MIPFLYFLSFAAICVFVLAWSQIFLKVGHNRWLCLFMLFPVTNLIVVYWLAFSRWPVYDFVEKGWDVKRLMLKRQAIARKIQDLTGQKEGVEKDIDQPKKQEGASIAMRNRKGSLINVVIAVVIAGVMIFFGWFTGYLQYSTLQNEYNSLRNLYTSLIKDHAGLVIEKQRLVSVISDMAPKEAELIVKQADLTAARASLIVKQQEWTAKQADYDKKLVNYEDVVGQLVGELNELKRLYPPRHFIDADELVRWRAKVGVVTGAGYFSAYKRLQEIALRQGFIVSVSLQTGVYSEGPSNMAFAGDTIYRLWPDKPNQTFVASQVKE